MDLEAAMMEPLLVHGRLTYVFEPVSNDRPLPRLHLLSLIRIKGSCILVPLILLSLCGPITLVLGIITGKENYCHEGLDLTIAMALALVIECFIVYLGRHYSPHLRGTRETQSEVSFRERYNQPYLVIHGYDQILVAGVGMPIDRSQLTGARMHTAAARDKTAFSLFFLGMLAVCLMLLLPLIIRTSVGAEDLGMWNFIVQGQDMVRVIVGIVRIIEALLVIQVVVQDGFSLLSITGSVMAFVHRIGWPSQSLYFTLQKSLQFQLAVILTVFLANFGALLWMGEMSLTVAQLVWASLIVVRIGELTLVGRPQMISVGDRSISAYEFDGPPWISNVICRNLCLQVFYQTSVLLFLQFSGSHLLMLDAGPEADKANQTVRFNALVFCQLFSLLNAQTMEEKNIFQGVLANPLLLGAVVGTMVLQVTLVEFGGMFASVVNLSWQYWLISIAIGFMTWPLACLGKFVPSPASFIIRMQ